jgi:hypothetical protein
MDSKKVLYFGLGLGAALLYMKYMKDRKLKADDIKNKAVNPTTPMTTSAAATNPAMGIVDKAIINIEKAVGKGSMMVGDLTKQGKRSSGGGGYSRKPMDVPLREYKNTGKNTGVANPDIIYGVDGVATSQVNDYTSISKACKCSDKTNTHQLGILQNFNR